jgi:hypothetical protein
MDMRIALVRPKRGAVGRTKAEAPAKRVKRVVAESFMIGTKVCEKKRTEGCEVMKRQDTGYQLPMLELLEKAKE